jgi:hypothetical protein
VAATVNVYTVFVLRLPTVIVLVVSTAVAPPGLAVTLKEEIADPLSVAGGSKVTVACWFPPTARAFKGSLGTPATIAAVAVLSGPYPARLRAETVNVYEVPFVSPLTVIGDSKPVAVRPSGVLTTRYSKMLFPPFVVGGRKLTVASVLPGTAVADRGAPGIVNVVTAFEGAEAALVPIEFVAVTVNV